MAGGVTLFGYWASPFALLVRWALKLKGVYRRGSSKQEFFAAAIQNNPAHKKCVPMIMRAFVAEGEEKEKAVEEARQKLKTLESGLKGKEFFGGETINYVYVATGKEFFGG